MYLATLYISTITDTQIPYNSFLQYPFYQIFTSNTNKIENTCHKWQIFPIYFKTFDGKKSVNNGDAFKLSNIKSSLIYVHNIIKAFNPNIEIYINEPLCACVTEETHKNAIGAMKLQHANIME